MMNKLKSARVHALRFLFLLPLLSALLLAFRNSPRNTALPPDPATIHAGSGAVVAPAIIDTVPDDAMQMDTVPAVTEPNEKGYFIDVKGRKADCVVVVKNTEGKEVKRLLLTDWKKKEKYYTDLYGEIQMPPPPPPPPTPPNKSSVSSSNTLSDDFEITDNNARITLKDGTVERYNLKDTKERATFEKKYGKIISVQPAKVATTATVVTTTDMPVTIVSPVITKTTSPSKVTAISSVDATTPVLTTVSPVIITKVNTAVKGTTVIASMAPVKGEAVAVIDDEDFPITGKEDLLITITKNSSREQLEDFKRQMKEKGVELKYDAIEYSAKGILRHISGTMKSKNGESRFSATDFKQVILVSDQLYFKVKVEDDKKVVI